ncbi:MAG: DNA-binding response regulator [Calditrichaeota bacterium]|nr:MAG: DNA-binding response regulator [Calditrichota bacterium]
MDQPEKFKDIWVVEDNHELRHTLEEVIDSEPDLICSMSFRRCEDLITALQKESPPQIILMDIGLPGMSGIEGLHHIRSLSPATQVIMLTIYEDDDKVFESLCAGAIGYLVKGQTTLKIVESIRVVLDGGAPMNARIARKVLTMFSRFVSPQADYALTRREQEILELLVQGYSQKQMAAQLNLSPLTVATHMKNIYAKLHVHSRTEAVVKALRERLI